jgi:hypothetical protein
MARATGNPIRKPNATSKYGKRNMAKPGRLATRAFRVRARIRDAAMTPAAPRRCHRRLRVASVRANQVTPTI